LVLARGGQVIEDSLMTGYIQQLPELRLPFDRLILCGLPESPEIRREIVNLKRGGRA
jgi:hypothetical protein